MHETLKLPWHHSISLPPPPLSALGGRLIPNFEKGYQKTNECLGGLKEVLPLCKINYGFEGSISNVDLALC